MLLTIGAEMIDYYTGCSKFPQIFEIIIKNEAESTLLTIVTALNLFMKRFWIQLNMFTLQNH